jgi:uncharacterized protein YndB with AHSA1/START domain
MFLTLIALAAAQPAPSQLPPSPPARTRPVGQVASPVRMEVTTEQDGSRTLTHELIVPAPVAQVYAAVAGPAGWRTWAVPHAWTSADDPTVMETSYSPNARAGNPGNIRQRFLLQVPNRLVAWRTIHAPPGFPHAELFYRVTHLFELEPSGAGTRVRLTGVGYPAGAAGDTLVGFFREGNRATLEQLRTRFVSGPVDWAAKRAAPQR